LHPVGQLIWPLGQVAQSVPLVLQGVPGGQVIVMAAHVPAALHIWGNVTTPFEHDWPAPHSVPTPLLPVSMQTIEPLEHTVMPFLHGFVGWQT
jgi:hypothetical protein